MNLPLSIFSDASLELGNNNAKDMISAAKEAGYGRAALVDVDSMSAAVRFIGAAKKNEIGTVIGATLTVYSPGREELCWRHENKLVIKQLSQLLGIAEDHSFFCENSVKHLLNITSGSLKNSLLETTVGKVRNAVKSMNEKFPEIDISSVPDVKKGNEGLVLSKLLEVVLGEAFLIVETQDKWTDLVSVLEHFTFGVPMGKLTFLAKTMTGYKNLMSLASMKAKRKHDNIKNKTCVKEAIHLDDISLYGDDVVVVDPMIKESLLGFIASEVKDPKERKAMFSQACDITSTMIDVLGVPYNANQSLLELLDQSDKKRIAFPTANYAKEEEYASYCVKVAVHRNERVNGVTFVPPEKSTFIHPFKDVHDYYKNNADDIKIDATFWDNTIADTDVPLGEVHMPNYDMPVKEVVEHAFKYSKGEETLFDSVEEADKAFELWLEDSLPEGTGMKQFRQKRLNDFCLHKLTLEGLEMRLKEQFGEDAESYRAEYMARIDHEYDVIESMGFAGYFLIEFDFVSYAREIGVPVGPGRGSAAGSLIVYCLEITDVDPIYYGLQFERFLNPERVSMPDIDVDFGDGGKVNRSHVLAYIRDKYQQKGSIFPSSSQIANINRYQLKSAIAAVRKAYNLTMTYDAYLKRMIKESEQALGIVAPAMISWDELMSLDDVLKKVNREPMLKRVLEMARALTGKMSAYGVHAGGVVISPTVISDFSALSCDDKGNYFSQLDKDDVESAGLIKFDVLGLRTLSIISECERQILKNHGKEVDSRKIDFFDPTVYELICQQVLSDVFQLESSGMRDLVGSLQPQSVDEIAVLSALFRPGALDSGMVEEYIDVKHGRREATYDHPALEKVTHETFGCIVYQEQVMSIVRELGGYSLGQADLLRRAMGKKKIAEMIAQRAVYSARAMAYWREHYIDVGKKQKFPFVLDVCLIDIKSELEMLGVSEHIDEKGFISEQEDVVAMMTKLSSMSDSAVELLEGRMKDYAYKVMLFKEHYKPSIETAIFSRLEDCSDVKKEEVFTRVYYALSQYIRFNQVFNKVEKFAGYGFNKSHAIAYSVVTYMAAFFKKHYPSEYYSAALSFKDIDKLHSTVLEAGQKMGVRILGPDINKSQELFSVENKTVVRYGLDKLKHMGESASSVVDERELHGAYIGVFDFLSRMKSHGGAPQSKGFVSLAVTGAFDKFIPSRVSRDRELNGRQYISWLRDCLTNLDTFKKELRVSKLHVSVDDMSEVEFACYLTSIAAAKEMKRVPVAMSPEADLKEGEEESKEALKAKTVRNEVLVSGVTGVLSKKKQGLHFHKALELANDEDNFPVLSNLLADKEQAIDNLTTCEWRFIRACAELYDCDDLVWAWTKHLRGELNKPISETLNEEREAAGFYMTSTPIKVLKIAEKVEREPPSSVIDGCPISVGNIDGNYHDQKVTTYGIIRDVVVKTVKKESSPAYGEKMMFFDLEDGAERISCKIFGTKQVNAFHNKVVSEGAVSLVAGDVDLGDFGLGINVVAIKRYFPLADDEIHVVPRGRR